MLSILFDAAFYNNSCYVVSQEAPLQNPLTENLQWFARTETTQPKEQQFNLPLVLKSTAYKNTLLEQHNRTTRSVFLTRWPPLLTCSLPLLHETARLHIINAPALVPVPHVMGEHQSSSISHKLCSGHTHGRSMPPGTENMPHSPDRCGQCCHGTSCGSKRSTSSNGVSHK